jgi:uncharacterized integral membrane protein (TIGR00697 family)
MFNQENNSYFKFLPLFSMLLVATKLGAMLFVGRNLIINSVMFPGGIVPFCTTFVILDIITNNYGLQNARKVIFSLILCEATFSLIIYFTLNVQPTSTANELAYNLVTRPVIRLFFASFCATITAYLLNCYLFSKLYILYSGRMLWLRCILATSGGELVFSLVWTFMYFYGSLNNKALFILVIDQYIFKVLFEVVTLPITYAVVWLLNKYEYPLQINFIDLTKKEALMHV